MIVKDNYIRIKIETSLKKEFIKIVGKHNMSKILREYIKSIVKKGKVKIN